MKMFQRRFVCCWLRFSFGVMFGLGSASVIYADGGQRPAAYLEYGVGGAPEAMAGAAAALRDDPACSFWNPAGLTGIKNIEVEAQNTFLSLNQSLDYFSLGANLQDKIYCGLTCLAYSAGNDLEARSGPSLNPDSTFGESEITAMLSGAFRLSPRWSGGFSLKLLLNSLGSIQNASGTGFGFDLGLQYRANNETTFGLAAQDPYTVYSYQNSSSTIIPTTLRLGVSRWEMSLHGKGAFDLEWSQDLGLRPRLGVEWFPFRVLALRGGAWVGDLTSEGAGEQANLNLTCGVGVFIPLQSSVMPGLALVDQIVIDYSLVPDPQISGAVLHQIAVTGKFM
jgi:hypothetical protein